MEKTILTPAQRKFLECIQNYEEITRWFYLTGGTALSEFYLHHRFSEDIDLFSTSEVDDKTIDKFLDDTRSQLQITSIKKGWDEEQILNFMVKKYKVMPQRVKRDLKELVSNLLSKKIISRI